MILFISSGDIFILFYCSGNYEASENGNVFFSESWQQECLFLGIIA